MTLSLIFPVLLLVLLAAVFIYYFCAMATRKNSLEWIAIKEARQPLTFSLPRHKMGRRDALPLILLTAAYAATAFFQLGSMKAPESFAQFVTGTDTEALTYTLPDGPMVSRFLYYPGLGTGTYTVECSSDGTVWDEIGTLDQTYVDLFKWKELPLETPVAASRLRITAHPDKGWMELGEVAVYDANGTLAITDGALALSDEQNVVPAKSTWFNSTYFDEIYHARTGYEHLRGVYPYELSHPPLGKLILSIGIALFGMNPFGWRVMGTLFGVLMVPLLYVFIKNLFGKTPLALCGTALFAFDFMHLTQTRIATIDTYAVFFILASYFFLYRYFTGKTVGKNGKPALNTLNLFLCGLTFGIGAACKWTVLYAGAGLAVLYFINLILRFRHWDRGENAPGYAPWLLKTLALSVLFFVVIPAGIYALSYLPYAMARGNVTLQSLLAIVLDNQKFMFSYHSGVTATHPYGSKWYQWIADARPILYYMDNNVAEGLTTRFGCFNNPVVAWGGLLALIVCGIQLFRRKAGKALFILVGYLAQLLPWVFISRVTFEYHYFPATLFLVLALCFVFNDLMDRGAHWRLPLYGLTGTAVGLYAAFYPMLIGLTVPTWYSSTFLAWLPSWPF
ncbi:MAG: phospholipid carrier-dependent glycosyltransferase [Oscillospiraceae bacterium]